MYKSRMTTSLKFLKEFFFDALNFEDFMFLIWLDMSNLTNLHIEFRLNELSLTFDFICTLH